MLATPTDRRPAMPLPRAATDSRTGSSVPPCLRVKTRQRADRPNERHCAARRTSEAVHSRASCAAGPDRNASSLRAPSDPRHPGAAQECGVRSRLPALPAGPEGRSWGISGSCWGPPAPSIGSRQPPTGCPPLFLVVRQTCTRLSGQYASDRPSASAVQAVASSCGPLKAGCRPQWVVLNVVHTALHPHRLGLDWDSSGPTLDRDPAQPATADQRMRMARIHRQMPRGRRIPWAR